MTIERIAVIDLNMIRLRTEATKIQAFELISDDNTEPLQRLVNRDSGNYTAMTLRDIIREFQSEDLLAKWKRETSEGARRFALLHKILDRTDNAPIILTRIAYAYNTLVHDFRRWIEKIYPHQITWTIDKDQPHLHAKPATVSYFIYRCNPETLGFDHFLGMSTQFCLNPGWRNNFLYLENIYQFTDVTGIAADEETQQ